MSRSLTLLLAAAAVSAGALLAGCASPAAPAMSTSIVEPADGAVVSSPFKVRFGVQGMKVLPAGDMSPNTGHHHLIIDAGPVAAGEVVTVSPKHIHFGQGQTETAVTLAPGVYKLTAQFANGAHQSYGPGMSQTVTVTVK